MINPQTAGGRARAGGPRRRLGLRSPEALAYTTPAWALLIAVVAIPIGVVFYVSFTSSSLIATRPTHFVGLANYRYDVFTSAFAQALVVTVIITVASVVVQFPVGYVLAEALSRRLRGRRFFRSVLLIPMLLTPVAVGLMWRLLFDPDIGLVRWVLSSVAPSTNFLGQRFLALLVLIFINAWLNIPFVMVMMIAGLGSLPQGPLEAAQIDGASAWRTLTHIKLPLLWPVILVTLLIRVMTDFKLFDIVYSVTQGGPGTSTITVSYLAYERGFAFYLTGQAAATAVAITILVLPLYFAFARIVRVRL